MQDLPSAHDLHYFIVRFKYQPEDDPQTVETYSLLTCYFYTVVFLTVVKTASICSPTQQDA